MKPGAQDIAAFAVLTAILACPSHAQHIRDLSTPMPVHRGDVVVVGFLGGIESWNDGHRGVRQLTLRLRDAAHPGVYAETFGNRNRRTAIQFLRRALDTNGDGTIDADEARNAKVILYGQSLGGSAAIRTARELQKLGVAVRLTVQVDSVGVHDGVIPANVAAAANFYQHDPLTIWGRSTIRAADPQHTRILGNFRLSYLLSPGDPSNTWVRRNLGGSHAKMEDDPAVWTIVEALILDAISNS